MATTSMFYSIIVYSMIYLAIVNSIIYFGIVMIIIVICYIINKAVAIICSATKHLTHL